MNRKAGLAGSVENDPKATFAGRFRRASLSHYDALSRARGKQCEGVTSSH